MDRCDYCKYKNSWDCEDGWDRVRNDKICDDFVLDFKFLSKNPDASRLMKRFF